MTGGRRIFSPFLFCIDFVWVIQEARSALKLKTPPFFKHFFRPVFNAPIGNWLYRYAVEKTIEHDVEDRIRIGSVGVG